jgi:KDO2-lipid IV(A) lauroyltransferase
VGELLVYYSVRALGWCVRCLPLPVALLIGRCAGMITYWLNRKQRLHVYAHLRMALVQSHMPRQLRTITKNVFCNYGENLIELLRMPLMNKKRFEALVTVEGKEHIIEARKKGKGVILLAMHFGSWELASVSCAMMDLPYKVFVRPQSRFPKLDELLNSYRSCGGTVVLTRGSGTRDMIRSLQNNDVVALVADQGPDVRRCDPVRFEAGRAVVFRGHRSRRPWPAPDDHS